MRSPDHDQTGMFSYISPDSRVPQDHPLRPIRQMVDQALRELSPVFHQMYALGGRPSIPPEQLLRALLLQVFYSIRSERLLVEQLEYNLLFRWFVGLSPDAQIWNHSTFSKNRDRLLTADVAAAFFKQIRQQAEKADLLSDEHFSVDGTLLAAWASLKSFRSKDSDGTPPPTDGTRNPTIDFRGESRSNATHQSTTDPDARLYRKSSGHTADLVFMGHVLMENRNGLAVEACVTTATGTAEREAAPDLVAAIPGSHRITVGADKAYDTADFVADVREIRCTPHVAQKDRGTAIDGRTTRQAGYQVSLTIRKRVEEIFGWVKTIGGCRQLLHRGLPRVGWQFTFALAAYNLIRIRNLVTAT